MKGQLTVQYLASFIFFIGLIIYIYFAYSANLPAFVEEVRKEDIRSKAFQLSEMLINDPGNWTELVEVPVDVILVIDVSSSMDGETSPLPDWGEICRLPCTGVCNPAGCKSGDPPGCICPDITDCDNDRHWADPDESPCPINDAKNAAKTFVDELNEFQDKSGVVVFNETAHIIQELVSDKNTVKTEIDKIYANRPSYTAIAGGIREATEELTKNPVPGTNLVQVLLSDGKDDPCSPCSDAEVAAQEAADENIKIYTIGLGPSYYLDEEVLNNIADITGGEYYHAPDSTELMDIYIKIAHVIKLNVKRIGLSDENFNKSNLISMTKIRQLENLCIYFEDVQEKLAFEEPFSLHVFNISQDSGKRDKIMECISPAFPTTNINTTIKRIVALDNTETGELELAELIIQM